MGRPHTQAHIQMKVDRKKRILRMIEEKGIPYDTAATLAPEGSKQITGDTLLAWTRRPDTQPLQGVPWLDEYIVALEGYEGKPKVNGDENVEASDLLLVRVAFSELSNVELLQLRKAIDVEILRRMQ